MLRETETPSPAVLFTSPLSSSLNEALRSDLVGLLSAGGWSSSDKLKPNYFFISRSFIGPAKKKKIGIARKRKEGKTDGGGRKGGAYGEGGCNC